MHTKLRTMYTWPLHVPTDMETAEMCHSSSSALKVPALSDSGHWVRIFTAVRLSHLMNLRAVRYIQRYQTADSLFRVTLKTQKLP
jgi:hypothetical protein